MITPAPTADAKRVRSMVLTAAAAGLIGGAVVGFSMSEPANPGAASPVTTLVQNRSAEDLCGQGYSVWSREGSRIC